jgi:AbrB family looped-hinge helix DNA binding protein
MSSSDSNGEEYGDATLNERGRLTIPKALRDELNLDDGTEFRVVREGTDIRLERKLPELAASESGRSEAEWQGEAFRDAGELTFGGE